MKFFSDSLKPFNNEFYVESNSLQHCSLIPESKPQDSVIIPKYRYGNVGEKTFKELSQFENEDLPDLKEEIIDFKNSTIDMDVSLVRTRSEFILSSSDKEDENSPLSMNHSQQICKSALRSSSSTGNLTKKKVVFLDELFSGDKRSFSDDKLNFSSSDCVTPKNSATSLDKINFNHNLHEEPQNPVNLNTTFTLQLPKLPSPASSLTSIGSSLLDISPTVDKNIKANASDKFDLELSLVDIEENLRSD
uniref:Uncharacterized protein n=1 Tax=Clastoptera arizonana TaxID=38151 RepID=A0A1B6EGG9_9HEMI